MALTIAWSISTSIWCSFLPARRAAPHSSGGCFDHGHGALLRKSSPLPIFALTRLAIGNRLIVEFGDHFFLLFRACKGAARRQPGRPSTWINDLVASGTA